MRDFILDVVLVDDHAVVREGYRRLLERCPDLRVSGEAATAAELLQLVTQVPVDVVVMDIALPGASGIEATRRLLARRADIAVLISTMYEDAIFPARALEAGALGYVTKASAPEVLLDGIRKVAQGQRFLSADAAQALAQRERAQGGGEALSAREFEILRLLAAGRGLDEISVLLSLSPKTIANYQSSLKQKLNVDSAAQLLRAAARLGLSPAD